MTALAPRHFAVLVGVCAIWGFNLIAVKAGVERVPPVFFTLLRFAILALAVAPFLRLKPGQMPWLLVAALCSGGLQFALFYIGIARSGSMSVVAIAGQLGLPFTTLLSVLLLGEQVRWRRWTESSCRSSGCCSSASIQSCSSRQHGLGLVVLAALVGAFGLVAMKRVQGVGPLELQAWFAWTSLPVLLGLTLWLEEGQLASLAALDWVGVGALLYTALASSLLAHTIFYWLIQRYPVTSVVPVTVLAPLFSVMFAVTLLGDRLDWRILVGGALTLTGVAIIFDPRAEDCRDGSVTPRQLGATIRRLTQTPSRAMLRAVGFTDADFRRKPAVGIASTCGAMVTPCNMHIDGLARAAAAGADEAGGKAVLFNTITVSDGISMGSPGMRYSLVSREVIADSIETVVGAEGFDGFVAIGGCDKNMPGCAIAMARLDRPAVFVYGGTIRPGAKRRDIVAVFEAVGGHAAAGTVSDRQLLEVERTAIPGPGSCGGMYTANTMASAMEALGLSLPNSSAQEAVSPPTRMPTPNGRVPPSCD
jgi:drug/metabolite transporter (DMT)-like permease